MASYGRRDDRRPMRDNRGTLADERGPQRDPFAPPRDDGFTVLSGTDEPHEHLLVCDECGLSFLSPPYRPDDKCPTAGGEFACRGRLRSMNV